jgi:hypothetical protein
VRRLARLWRRVTSCRRGEHRETCEGSFGVLRWRCLDCDRATPLGWIYVGCSNKKVQPWEEA